MIRGIESVLLFSKDPGKLAGFYREKVGLKVELVGEYGEKNEEILFQLKMGKTNLLYILHHSKIHGNTKEPERVMINYEVDNIEKEFDRLIKNKVKKIQDIYHIEDYGKIATFRDLDGNFFQIVQVRA